MSRALSLLQEGARALGLELGPRELDLFHLYLAEIIRWRAKINITGFRTEEDIILKGFLDSLSCHKAIPMKAGLRVLDVGTGIGFPGLPLKISFPYLDLTFIESSRKKVSFLKHVCRFLGLRDVKCLWGRAEDLLKGEGYRGRYDVVLARAVSRLASIGPICVPFLKKGGIFIAPKGPRVEKEIREARETLEGLGSRVKGVIPVPGFTSNIERHIVVIERTT